MQGSRSNPLNVFQKKNPCIHFAYPHSHFRISANRIEKRKIYKSLIFMFFEQSTWNEMFFGELNCCLFTKLVMEFQLHLVLRVYTNVCSLVYLCC